MLVGPCVNKLHISLPCCLFQGPRCHCDEQAGAVCECTHGEILSLCAAENSTRGENSLEAGQSGGWTVWRLDSLEAGQSGDWTVWRLDSLEAGQSGGWTVWRLDSLEAGQSADKLWNTNCCIEV